VKLVTALLRTTLSRRWSNGKKKTPSLFSVQADAILLTFFVCVSSVPTGPTVEDILTAAARA
jgi:hypothetical protein